MATNEELNNLRAEVRRRHKAANAKVSRLRANGIELGGTSFDVRRDLAAVKRYNKNQLRGYLGRLNNFVARGNGFVPGDQQVPIRRAKWDRYVRAENRNNELAQGDNQSVSGLKLPNGSNVGQRKSMLAQKAIGSANNSPYAEIRRKSTNITSEAALDTLTKQLEDKAKKPYLSDKIKAGRREAMEMMKESGASLEQMERLNNLSDYQFHVMWNHTNAATELSSWYERAKLAAAGQKERANERIAKDNEAQVNDLLQWAEILPTAPEPTQRKKPRARRK